MFKLSKKAIFPSLRLPIPSQKTASVGPSVTQNHPAPPESEVRSMPGVVVFKTVNDAIKAGYQIYDKTSKGYLVRIMTPAGWAQALVEYNF